MTKTNHKDEAAQPKVTGAKATGAKVTGENRLPGDATKEQIIDRMLRVNYAGEYGAVRIYEGQLAVLKRMPSAPAIAEMKAQEEKHLETFTGLIAERGARPTLLTPLWHLTGFALGAATALISEKAAMACTVAVEEVIDEHYAAQTAKLGDDETELRETLEDFRQDELRHRDEAILAGARDAPAYSLLTTAVKAGSRLAIWMSERV